MSNRSPKLTVGMPVYNEAQFLSVAVKSILDQDFDDFEFIISDNASSDGTEHIARQFAGQDRRIRYVRQPRNKGTIANVITILKMARGQFIMFGGGHDYWEPQYMSRCIEAIESDESIVLAYTEAWWGTPESRGERHMLGNRFDTRGLPLSRRLLTTAARVPPYAIYGVMRTHLVRNMMLWKPSFGPDLKILFHLATSGSFAYIPEPLFCLRRTVDTNHIHRSINRQGGSLGPRGSFTMIVEFFRTHWNSMLSLDMRSYKRNALFVRVVGRIFLRWYRLIIAVLMAGFLPFLLNAIELFRGRRTQVDD